MGPPKKGPPRIPYSEVKRRYDTFEYRWDFKTGTYYLFNPFTGETIYTSNDEMLNRKFSLWGPIDKYPVENAQTMQLLPDFYVSRRWGRRKFYGWQSWEAAAVHITAVGRGFLARLHLRQYYNHRYVKKMDKLSSLYYYVDSYYPEREAFWYKPSLAFPDDIGVFVEDDPDDLRKGKKYSKAEYTKGPFIKVAGISKDDVVRVELDAFLIKNPIREHLALRKYSQIDLNTTHIGDVIHWFNGDNIVEVEMNEYHIMRTAIHHGDWNEVMALMKAYPDNAMVQLYGFHGLSKTEVPLDVSGVMDFVTQEAMQYCLEVIKDHDMEKYPQLYRIFALRAFHNIVSCRPARVEYLNTESVAEQGELRQPAIEKFVKERLIIFNKYLTNIPNETIQTFEKGGEISQDVIKPLPRSVEVVEEALRCLCVLAQEQETKEQMCYIVLEPTLFALDICQDEPSVVESALQLFYNLCYRCESAHESMLLCIQPKSFFALVHHHHSGDPGVMRQCRRLELTFEPDGWRGNIEAAITNDMKMEEMKAFNDSYLMESAELPLESWDEGAFAAAEGMEYVEDGKAEEKGDYMMVADGKHDHYYEGDEKSGSKFSDQGGGGGGYEAQMKIDYQQDYK